MTKKVAGFTLVELIVVLGLLSMVVIIITNLYVNQSTVFYQESETALLQEEANTLKERITDDIHSALEVVETINLEGIQYASSENQIVLKLPALNSNYQTRYDEGEIVYFDYLVYKLDKGNKTITFKSFPHPLSFRKQETKTYPYLEDSSEFTFLPQQSAWPEVKAINVFIKLAKKVQDKVVLAEFSDLIKLRNN